MANELSPMDVIRPVPIGGSWTDAPKSRPWTNPPKMVKVDEIAQKYIDNLSSSTIINSIIDVVETKVPLASMAESIMLTGVASGAHTIDAGILVLPVILEMLKTASDLHGIEYTIFPDDGVAESQIPIRVINAAIKKAMAPKDIEPAKPPSEPVVEVSGLMARRSSKAENENGI